MSESNEKRSTFPYSVILIVVGALLLFGNVGFFGLDSLIGLLARLWPLIFLIRGISRMQAGVTSFGTGLRDAMFGFVMLAVMLGLLPGNLLQLWPFILIVVGLWLILVPAKNVVVEKTIAASEFTERFVFRGARLMANASHFSNGRLHTSVAAIECDLSETKDSPRFMKLELRSFLSRVILRVPDDWRIVTDLSGKAHAVHDHRELGNPHDGVPAPTLHIIGNLTFSSLDITDPS